jgi:hypothetical protein
MEKRPFGQIVNARIPDGRGGWFTTRVKICGHYRGYSDRSTFPIYQVHCLDRTGRTEVMEENILETYPTQETDETLVRT